MSTYVLAIAMWTLGYIEDTTEIGEVPERIYAPAELLSSMQVCDRIIVTVTHYYSNALNYRSHTLHATVSVSQNQQGVFPKISSTFAMGCPKFITQSYKFIIKTKQIEHPTHANSSGVKAGL